MSQKSGKLQSSRTGWLRQEKMKTAFDKNANNAVGKSICEQIQPSTQTERMRAVSSLLSPLYVNNDLCCTLERRIRLSLEWGLRKETNSASSIKCFPTYVRDLPTGQEQCECLAVDLGGTNLRCILVRLEPGAEPELLERKASVPEEIQKGSGDQLFK